MKRLSLKEKLYRNLKANEPADDIYTAFIRLKTEEQKKEVIELLKSYAKVDNRDIELRTKSLALIEWYKSMDCGKDMEEFYKDLNVIYGDTEIPRIIEENCVELIDRLKRGDAIFLKESNLLEEVILVIGDYELKTSITKRFFEFVENYLDLKEKHKKKILNEREAYIYDQINRIKKGIKILIIGEQVFTVNGKGKLQKRV